jgi:hypothetical protein
MLGFYTILKAPVSTVVSRHLFTNNPSHLFQINLLHDNSAQAHHTGLLTVLGQPVSPFD